MPFYKINPDSPPPGVLHRVLCTRTDLYHGCHVIETKEKIDGYEEADPSPLGDVGRCVAEWVTVEEKKDDIEAYQAAVEAAAEQYLKPQTKAAMKIAVVDAISAVSAVIKEATIGRESQAVNDG